MIDGASPDLVERAIDSGDPFPGTTGFAGRMPDGRLVRDVLGRVPLFVDGDPETWTTETDWSFEHSELADPREFPAGSVLSEDGIERVWELPELEPLPSVDALEGLREAMDTAIGAVQKDGAAIAFSGGVDSAYLAARLDAPLYTVGFADGHDVAVARETATELGTTTTVRELSIEDVEAAVPTVARAIGRTNAMDVQIALPLYFVASVASADGYDRLVLGQGADELFGGYSKVEMVDHRVDAETVRGARNEVLRGLPSDATRDTLAVRAAGIEPVTPYLHDAVVQAALRLPTELIVEDAIRKRALRIIAADVLPETVASRPKKAMQYGSLVARELDRLARQDGFKRRMDDHVAKYVESRLE